MRGKFRNPILSGFYPDPSICRVGEDYYMVTSSFAYYPGLPIHHSKDLIHWEQIGHGIHRPDQLDYKNCEASLGLWAPTIRYHEGKFYIINTLVSEGREARRDNYIITADRPEGPWSDPVFVEGADGIDSSLFFDEDGSVWYVGNYICKENLYEGHHGIYLCELDKDTLQFKGERKILWDGITTRGKWLEAPHIYKINGMYYLMVAEGGTFTNHSVMMARSSSVAGPYEVCQRNPVVSHRHLPLDRDISVTGHGDLIETQNGEWWMVLLGVRPYEAKKKEDYRNENGNIFYNLGRETFLLPMTWGEDGWPIAASENGIVNEWERKPELPEYIAHIDDSSDNFEDEELRMMWNTLHQPVENFYSLTERSGFLRLKLRKETLEEINTPSFVGRRQQHMRFLAKTAMEFTPAADCEEAGAVLLQDDRFHITFTKAKKGTDFVLLIKKTEYGKTTLLSEIPIKDTGRIYLQIQGNESNYTFAYGYRESERIDCGLTVPAEILSSSVNGGFTGTYIGMYAVSAGKGSENYADFDWFHYHGI